MELESKRHQHDKDADGLPALRQFDEATPAAKAAYHRLAVLPPVAAAPATAKAPPPLASHDPPSDCSSSSSRYSRDCIRALNDLADERRTVQVRRHSRSPPFRKDRPDGKDDIPWEPWDGVDDDNDDKTAPDHGDETAWLRKDLPRSKAEREREREREMRWTAAISQQPAAFHDAASTSTDAIAPPGDPMDTVIEDAVREWYALNGNAPNLAQVHQMTQGPPPPQRI